MMSLDITYIFI